MENLLISLYSCFTTALCLTITIITLAASNYSRTGPRIRKEIEKQFGYYLVLAIARLALWLFIIFILTSLPGSIAIYSISKISSHISFNLISNYSGCFISSAAITFYFFLHQLLYSPGSIQISFQYRFSRLLFLWELLSPSLIGLIKHILLSFFILTWITALCFSAQEHDPPFLFYTLATAIFYLSIYYAAHEEEPPLIRSIKQKKTNIVMIGADTLRSDRIGGNGYPRDLTPNIDKLRIQGVRLKTCITPLARTAPSIASLFTGLWPQNHRIRDNYPSEPDCQLPHTSLIDILNQHGYLTAAISDWCGGDFAKLSFNFSETSVAEDQWNIKLLLRQGPSLIRNVLSLFAKNALGKRFLPEFYYLAGATLTSQLGRECRKYLARCAQSSQPFFINLFTSTTHVPFNSEYPYYNLFTSRDYKGESRFIMTRLASPEEVINKQEKSSEFFDVPQIINLYDSCVKQFDDEVGKIMDYIDKSGLSDNTIIIIYSDHGADFFETGCWGQGNTLIGNDPSGKIPLILKGPGIPQGIEFEPITRSIDVMPTLLELLNIPRPENIDGTSLVPHIENQTSPELFAYQETGIWLGKIPGLHPRQIYYPNIVELLDIPNKNSGTLVVNEKFYPDVIYAKNRSIQNQKWKLIYIPTYDGPIYQLYDLETDPYKDIINQFPDIFDKLKVLLDEHIANDPVKPAPQQ
ncbi:MULTISPECIES: sulfatase [Methylomonas]|nr:MULTISPECIES: sulfatase [Methylomonas]ATG90782.1 hypothetical protein MKLM6_2563 [Methylomonas koyamae]